MKDCAIRNCIAALAAALLLSAASAAATGAPEKTGAVCCIDLGLRLMVTVDGEGISGALVLPNLFAGQGSAGGTQSRWFAASGFELFSLTVGAPDIVRWATPAVGVVAGMRSALWSKRGQSNLR